METATATVSDVMMMSANAMAIAKASVKDL